jgi:hydrogenase-4 component B
MTVFVMHPETFLEIGSFCFLLGSVLFLLPFRKTKTSLYILSAAGALNFLLFGLFLSFGIPVTLRSIPLSSVFGFLFSGDAISGFFVIVISLLAVSVSVYSMGYARDVKHGGFMGFLFNLFILSMYAVVISGNIITFLISWETMSVVSYFLVTLDRDEESARAGIVYAVMTHIGTAFLIASFLILYRHTGHMDFAGMKASASGLPEDVKSVVFLLFVAGFGAKAGIIPLHTWLPRAHPAAPSNISSLMSGVMIKTGIYGMVRMIMDVLGQGSEWWGIALIVIGAVSSVLGVLYALMEHDIKRLLAYHSVENIGIILLGIGASMMFRSNGLYNLSAIALIAGLYHTLNHALFKGLLFLGAGSVMHATHTKNMEDMGGLLRAMPYTGLFFLVGSVSICALPPFNGFVSEWLTFQSLLLGFDSPSITSKIISPLGGAALALTGALAAACFVKAFGISFLGTPRSRHAEGARESSISMIIGMALLSMLCLAFGLFPGLVVSVLSPLVFGLTGAYGVMPGNAFLPVAETASSLSPGAILIAMTVAASAAVVFVFAAGGRRKTTHGDSWDCGMTSLTPKMQYSATAFTKPLRLIFRRIYLPKRELSVSYTLKPFFVKSIKYSGEITPFFERYLYEPAIGLIHRIAGKVRLLQSGSLHLYLGYILVTLIVLLIFGS